MKREILRKTLCGALAASLVLSLAGCKPNGGEKAPSSAVSSAGSEAASQPKEGEVPRLGVADTDYDGFQYLEKKVLSAESEEGEEKSPSIAVFLPQDEYASVHRSRASSQRMGLTLTVDLDPLLQYQAEDYTLAENLDEYLDAMFDPESTLYDSMTVGKAQEDAAAHSAKATVTYCYYDDYDEEMIPYYVTYYLAELDNGLTVMVDAEINGEAATGKLPGLLDEIEAFYGFRPEWDAKEAEKLAEKAEAAGHKESRESSGSESSAVEPQVEDLPAVKNADGTFTASGLTFRLPEGWDIDESDREQSTFAPDGDAAFAGHAVMLMRQYSGTSSSDLELFQSNPEMMEAMLNAYMKNSLGDEAESANMNFKMCENAPFGAALKMDMVQDEGIINAYFLFDESGYLYLLIAADTEDSKPAAQALDTMFGSVKLG